MVEGSGQRKQLDGHCLACLIEQNKSQCLGTRVNRMLEDEIRKLG